MVEIAKLLFSTSCQNRLEAFCWFLGRRYFRGRSELLLKLSSSGRRLVIPVSDIQTLAAGLGLFTAANPWERWTPAMPPRRVLDLGGNVGLASLYFAVRFPGAQIVSVEMMPENAAAIKRLADLNRLKVEIRNVAVGAIEGTATVRLNQSHTRHSLEQLQASQGSTLGFLDQIVTVPITRLGTLIAALGWPGADLLKVDIEGAEKLLLDDIDGWSGRVHDVLLEIHHNVDAAQTENLMVSHSFRKIGQDHASRTELWFSK